MPGPTRRSRVPGGRGKQITVWLSQEELATIQEAAERAGMAPGAWLGERGMAAAAQGHTRVVRDAAQAVVGELDRLRQELLQTRRVLANVGGNLNDVARHANSTSELAAETAQVQRLVARVVEGVEVAAGEVLAQSMATMASYRGAATVSARRRAAAKRAAAVTMAAGAAATDKRQART